MEMIVQFATEMDGKQQQQPKNERGTIKWICCVRVFVCVFTFYVHSNFMTYF